MRPYAPTFSLLVAAAALAGCVHTPDLDSGAEPRLAQTREFDLWVSEEVRFNPVDGKEFVMFGFGLSKDGPFSIPGPELRVREGDRVIVRLHDPVAGVGHTIHWHGISVPWAMDGVPFMTQDLHTEGVPTVYTYEFTAHETGTYWYHCHVDAPTHVDAGLFGVIIVEPADPAQDPPFDRDYSLVLHELDSTMFRAFEYTFGGVQPTPGSLPANPFDAAEGAVNAARTAADIGGFIAGGTTGEYLGSAGPRDYYPEPSLRYRPEYDLFMLNGRAFPDTEPLFIRSDETVRIRMVNAGQLIHTMHLHGHHFLVTHKDGYNLPAPYWADSLLIGPGERYDVYVEGNNPGHWDFHDHGGGWDIGAYAATDHAFPGGMTTMLVYEDFEDVPLPQPRPDTAGEYRVFAPSSKLHRHG